MTETPNHKTTMNVTINGYCVTCTPDEFRALVQTPAPTMHNAPAPQAPSAPSTPIPAPAAPAPRPVAPAPRPVAETASRIRPTPPEFKFDDVHADARTKACIIAKILREYGPLGRKGLFARAKEYAIFAAVTRAQAAYSYASILVEGGVAVNVSAGKRGLWAISRNAGIESDADIAAAVQLIQKPLFEKLGGRGRAALSAIAATLAI